MAKRKYARRPRERSSCSGMPTAIPGPLKLRNRIGIPNWQLAGSRPPNRLLRKLLAARAKLNAPPEASPNEAPSPRPQTHD